jgi:hypothetical protein
VWLNSHHSSEIPPWVLDLKAYVDEISRRTPFYREPVSSVILAEAYLEQRRIAYQLEPSSGVEPEIEEIIAEAVAFTDLSIDTDEDDNRTPRNGPKNSFVVLAQPAPADIQTCGTVARTQIEEYLHTVENSISEQPILCAYTTNIRQHPEDPNDQGF